MDTRCWNSKRLVYCIPFFVVVVLVAVVRVILSLNVGAPSEMLQSADRSIALSARLAVALRVASFCYAFKIHGEKQTSSLFSSVQC